MVEPCADVRDASRRDPEHDMKQERRMAQRLRDHEGVRAIRTELEAFVGTLAASRRCSRFAWAIEICGRTFLSSGTIRVHAHAVFDFSKKVKMHLTRCSFKNTSPHISEGMGAIAFSRGRNRAAALYYLQAPKVSCVFQGGSHVPFEDYGVQPFHIFMMAQSNKMLFQDARRELAKIPLGIAKNIEHLERWHRERCAEKQQEYQEWHQRQLQHEQRPWRRVPLVEVWLLQYRQSLSRYRFLVLDGPSRMGKTQYARALCREGGVLELNMAGGAQADLREFDPLLHELLLFDECTPQQVLQNKKLFQAGPAMVQMGTSSTNMYAFGVYVAGVKFVVSSNVWAQELRRLTVADAEWIVQNSYLVHVERPLWIEASAEFLPFGGDE